MRVQKKVLREGLGEKDSMITSNQPKNTKFGEIAKTCKITPRPTVQHSEIPLAGRGGRR